MSYSINVSGHGPADDDLRAVFGELVRSLRSVTPEGQADPYAVLSTSSATYAAADIPDDEPADDEPDGDARQNEDEA